MQYFQLWQLCLKNFVARTTLVVLLSIIGSTAAGATNTFYMDLNGNYKYSFTTDNGIHSEQTANQHNEVTGHYMYYDNGVPFMVRYRAGVNGYQPEIIDLSATKPVAAAAAALLQPITTKTKTKATRARTSPPPPPPTAAPKQAHATPTPTKRTETKPSPGIGSSLNFVQTAMKLMQTQPLRISFNSQNGLLQPKAATAPPAAAPPAPATDAASQKLLQLPQLLSNERQYLSLDTQANAAEVATAEQQQQKRRPYSFSYSSARSAHSETSDKNGNVAGKYAYYDETGYHDLSYKAGDDIGFVVVGGNLAQPTATSAAIDPSLFDYQSAPKKSSSTSADRNANRWSRSLRKFRWA